MDRNTIVEHLQEEPFRPFIVVTSSGHRYEVRSPDLVVPLKSRLFIALPPEKGDVPDQAVNVSYLHITAIEEPQAA